MSSFGFGGANARADVFAIASRGPRKPKKVGGNHGRKLGGRLFSAFLVSSFGVFSWNLDKVKGISTFTILDRRA